MRLKGFIICALISFFNWSRFVWEKHDCITIKFRHLINHPGSLPNNWIITDKTCKIDIFEIPLMIDFLSNTSLRRYKVDNSSILPYENVKKRKENTYTCRLHVPFLLNPLSMWLLVHIINYVIILNIFSTIAMYRNEWISCIQVQIK